MRLTTEQIKSITCGAVRILEEEKGLRFWRFTKEQEVMYYDTRVLTGMNYRDRSTASAGVRFAFRTDSRKLALTVEATPATSRFYYDFEVLVNGVTVGSLNNHDGKPYPLGRPKFCYPLGENSGEFALGSGEKLVEVYFPWSVCPFVKAVELDDGATLTPVKRSKKMLVYGDSITQGYDSTKLSRHYTAQIAKLLDADIVSKAIGGEIFHPPLAKLKDELNPDYITVAYGTNDFSKTDSATFESDCKAFFTALRENYPNAKIFALTPVWRADLDEKRRFGDFLSVDEKITNAVADIANVTVIHGYDFIPHDPAMFGDVYLHPSDEGFDHFARNACTEIAKHL